MFLYREIERLSLVDGGIGWLCERHSGTASAMREKFTRDALGGVKVQLNNVRF
jgi:hypothetical protein